MRCKRSGPFPNFGSFLFWGSKEHAHLHKRPDSLLENALVLFAEYGLKYSGRNDSGSDL